LVEPGCNVGLDEGAEDGLLVGDEEVGLIVGAIEKGVVTVAVMLSVVKLAPPSVLVVLVNAVPSAAGVIA
jgi:hypothetical protein